MHLEFEAADKNSFVDPLQDVAADNGAEDKIGGGKIEARMRQSHTPRPPTERQMHGIAAQTENIADRARGEEERGEEGSDATGRLDPRRRRIHQKKQPTQRQ